MPWSVMAGLGSCGPFALCDYFDCLRVEVPYDVGQRVVQFTMTAEDGPLDP